MVQTRAASQIAVQQLITTQALEFPPLIALTMQRKALAETAGLRWICTGPLLRPESSRAATRVIHRLPSGMSLATIRLPRVGNLAARTQARDRALVRATAVAVHIRAAAAEDRRLTGTVEVHHPMLAEAAIANHTRAPALTTGSGAARTLLVEGDSRE
jgi:hypothetical protein